MDLVKALRAYDIVHVVKPIDKFIQDSKTASFIDRLSNNVLDINKVKIHYEYLVNTLEKSLKEVITRNDIDKKAYEDTIKELTIENEKMTLELKRLTKALGGIKIRKFSCEDVKFIRALSNPDISSLAKKFECSETTIHNILTKKTYKDCDGI